MFHWWTKRRRRQLLAAPFPEDWEAILAANIQVFPRLPTAARDKLRRLTRVLLAEKNWEGCDGLQLTDEMRVTIGGHAARMLLGFDDFCFEQVLTILVYPTSFRRKDRRPLGGDFFVSGERELTGEAWYRGPVIVAWDEVLEAGRGRGQNVVLHEFAHQLDFANGRIVDGMPPLPNAELERRWIELLPRERRRLWHECQQGRATLLDCYGTENAAEFFAVATECFFERPAALAAQRPELYALLRDFYQQDLAGQ